MLKRNQAGDINVLVFPLAVLIILLIAAVAFGVWAYNSRQDYKNDSDQKSAAAVVAALKVEDAKKEAEFAAAAKDPLKTFVGPETAGSLQVSYPKTWSAYIGEGGNGDDSGDSTPLNAYFYPDYVPAIGGENSDGTPSTAYALRIQILDQNYATSLQAYSSQVIQGSVTLMPYTLPKMPKIVGSKIVGKLLNGVNGTLVVLPLRSQTIELWTEAPQFVNDFTTNVLPYVSFSP